MKRSGLSVALVLAVACVTSCGKKDVEQPDQPPVDQQQPPVDGQAQLTPSKCHGNKVPPRNYLQETAFVPAGSPNASEEAAREAQAKLRDRICQGYRCSELAPKVTLWHTEQDTMQVCAMAVLKAADVEEFKAGPRKQFDADLAARAQQLMKSVKRKKEPRIAFDNVTDMGVDGGPRAEWLVDRMTAALSSHDALIATIDPDWSGMGLPDGVDAVLRANITPMHGREALLEVTWKIQLEGGLKAVEAISFPELIGPSINPLSQLPDLAGINPNIALRFDARPGGGLCEGQETELRLETSTDLHVRVVNLFGDGSQGIVIWAPKDVVKGGQPQKVGARFKVVKFGDVPVERFLVLGSPTKEGLGVLSNAQATCRLPKALATQFSANRGYPKGTSEYVTSRSYRILEGEECSSFQPEKVDAGWFAALPECESL